MYQCGRAAGVCPEEVVQLKICLESYVLSRAFPDVSECRYQVEEIYDFITVDLREEVMNLMMNEVVLPILRALGRQDSFRVYEEDWRMGWHMI